MKQRILVLGANGYVGRRVVSALADSDWADPVAGVRRARQQGREIVLDATDPAAVTRALGEVDAVVNCVAGSADAMTAGARALATALDARALRLVHFSSMAVYGAARGDISEDHPMAANLQGYAGAKVETERLLAARDTAITLRPGCIYGPNSPQWSLRIADLLRAHRIGDLGAAGVHDRQALVLVNRGGATAADILALARAIQDAVAERYGVALEPEPVVV